MTTHVWFTLKTTLKWASILLTAGMCLSLSGCEQSSRSAAPPGHWISLFNGRDLQNWIPKFAGFPVGHNYLDTFRVADGKLIVSYDQYTEFAGRFGHLFHASGPHSHYWIRAEYRFVGEQVRNAPDWGWRNNGLMLHAQPPDTMQLNQEQPVSIEVRLLGGSMLGKRPTANLCLIKTSVLIGNKREADKCLESSSATYRGNQWVLVEAEVRGGQVVRHYVNGKQVMEYQHIELTEPQPWLPNMSLTSGYIGIQAETHPTEFRRLDILTLPE